MRVIIQDSADKTAQWAARYIAAAINKHVATDDSPFVLGLPTGSTPLGTYRELIELHKRGEVSFANVITFNMDEYVGIAEDHPQSYHYFMWHNFFSHVDIKKENVNILNGNAKDLVYECRYFEERIAEAGGIDLFLGGVGSDGHIAFNEPFSSLVSRTRIKSLTMETIVDNSRFFDHDINKVPKLALTVGVGTITDSREVIILATGLNKATAVKHAVEGDYSHKWTITALQTHQRGIIVCDEAAANELTVGTYKYLKDIERDNLDPMTITVKA